ncbi:MAG: gamma-glutamyltransferase [Bacteroidota bacterium]
MKLLSPFLLVLCLFTACKGPSPSQSSSPLSQSASSANGMVSTAHPLASRAGIAMLEKGGNAIDAAVAAGFALAVVEPSMSGLGGRLQAILMESDGSVHGVDATTQAPMDYDPETAPKGRYGYPTIGIPGVVAGLCKLNQEYGTLPLAEVIAPAIQYAEQGFELLSGEAFRQQLAHDQLMEFDGSRQYFLNGDSSRKAGDLWVQKDLAQTLRQIKQFGREAFYSGEIAQKIVADVQANGGVLSMEALAQYEAKDARILEGSYHGLGLHGLHLPSFGAITIEILHILENLPMKDLHGNQWANAVNHAIAMAYEDRPRQSDEEVLELLLSKEYAAELAQHIDLDTNRMQAVTSQEFPPSWAAPWAHTTHLTATDKMGNVIALTQTIGPNMGSKVATPGLGFLYAVTLGGYLGDFQPGQRAASHISPFIITKDKKPYLVLGAAGGSRIVPAVAAVSTRVIDHQLSLEEALAAPRVHPVEDSIFLETTPGEGWQEEVISDLKAKGFLIKEISDAARFGRVHAVLYDEKSGQWIGAADPDWEGVAGGPLLKE